MPIRAMMLRGQSSAGGSDPYWGNVTSLLHFDGINGSTSFVDERGNSWSVMAGNPRLTTSTAKFGPSSLRLPNGGYVSSPTALGSGVGAGDFTIEGWFLAVNQSHRGLMHTALTSSVAGIAIGHEDTAGGQWQVYFNGTSYTASGLPLVLNTWQHFALVRIGTTCRLFISGNVVLTFTSPANVTAPSMVIGCYWNSAFPWGWEGGVDEVRFTVGVGRYSGNFTPPSAPFPDA